MIPKTSFLNAHRLTNKPVATHSDPGDSGAAISMRDIVKKFKTTAGDVTVLKGINTDFMHGEFVSVVGKSGSGKSTLINMITGIDRPTSGEVCIGGTLINALDESQMAKWRGINLGIVFQFYQLLPMLSLIENTMLPMDFSDLILRSEREGRALELLRMVGLGKHAHKMPAEVSGGQQQVAAIARALANDPPLIIADEPTGNLDSRTAESVMEIFERLVERGKTIIMVTHDPTLAQRTTRSLLLADGEIIHDVVARTFPMLTHSEMLKITHELEVRQYAPGATVVREGNAIDDFQIITKGSVQIAVKDVPVTKLSSGEFFGEIELLQEQPAIATIRNTDVTFLETVSINRNSFRQLVLDTKEFKETILPVVHTRLTENHSVRSRLGLNRRKHAQTTLA